jgi:hypothetical protein
MIVDIPVAASERYKVRQTGKRGLMIGLPSVYVEDTGISATDSVDIRRVGMRSLLITPAGEEVEIERR